MTATKPLALPLALAARLAAWRVPGVAALVELGASFLLTRLLGLATPPFLRAGALARALGRPVGAGGAAPATPVKPVALAAKAAAAAKEG